MRILPLFFVSGATALVYEVVWSKYLALILGSTIQAQTFVLASFMGGLALGNKLFGARADRLPNPVAVYGYIEVLIGLYAFFFPQLYKAGDALFMVLGANQLERPMVLAGAKFLVSALLLLPPTILMGATLPLMAGWLRRQEDAGRKVARFYSVNSLGAVLGAWMGGFVLVRGLGLVSSLQMTGLVNVLVGIAAVVIGRQLTMPVAVDTPQKGEISKSEVAPIGDTRLLVVMAAIAGGVSMGLEVLFSRALGMIVGGSLQAFSIVLMAFIFGIGIGGAIVADPRFARWQSMRTVHVLMLGAALLVWAFIAGIERWAIVYSHLRMGLAANEIGFVGHQLLTGLLAGLAMGLPAMTLGAVLPLMIRLSSAGSADCLGREVGRLLTWNTLGAVAGVALTGFVLLPAVGLRGAMATLAIFLAAASLLLAWRRGEALFQGAGAAVVVLVGLTLLAGGDGWRHSLGSGIFRMRNTALTSHALDDRKKGVEILYYKDGADATVSVETTRGVQDAKQIIMRINGKTDASSQGDLATQYLLAHLPMMARPDSKDVFILGLGSGITAGAVLGHPIESLVVAENCGPVIEAAKHFNKWNRSAMDNPKTKLYKEDARTVLRLGDRQYDVIISEPSNPWVAGIGSVFSKEFYELCASHLKEGGVMSQWFHIYEMHDGIVSLVVRTFSQVFPNVEIWDTQDGDIVMLGSLKPWDSTPSVWQRVYERTEPRKDLEEIGLKTAVSAWSRQAISQRLGSSVFGDAGGVQSDEFPILEYAAPEAFFIGRTALEIFMYDERVWMSRLASPEKARVGRALPTKVLGEMYEYYESSNPQLKKYLTWRLAAGEGPSGHPVYPEEPTLPVIFRPTTSYPTTPILPRSASAQFQDLALAELAILKENPDPAQGLDRMHHLLAEMEKSASFGIQERSFRPAHFAALGATEALAKGRFDMARDFIRFGRRYEPANIHLALTQRILDKVAPVVEAPATPKRTLSFEDLGVQPAKP